MIHQVIRVMIPAISSATEQSSIPLGHPKRTTIVSISLLTKALIASIAVTATGYFIEENYELQTTLMALHAVIFLLLIVPVYYFGLDRKRVKES